MSLLRIKFNRGNAAKISWKEKQKQFSVRVAKKR
jgi:hypothetical protein